MVAIAGKHDRLNICQWLAAAAGQLFQEPGRAQTIQGVLETGAVTVLSIPVIALDTHNDFCKFGRFVCGNEANILRRTGVAVIAIVELAHPAAYTDIEANQFVVAYYGGEPEVLTININIVERWDSKADLELTGQV